MRDSASDISLGSTMETLRALYGVSRSSEERELLDWHLANLEYANAGCLSDLSVAYWDQDDPYEMGGDHCFLAGGNWRLINAMCRDVPVLCGKTVSCIRYGDSSGTEVVAREQVFQADMVLSTVPLGVLKSGSIRFEPPLPPHVRCSRRQSCRDTDDSFLLHSVVVPSAGVKDSVKTNITTLGPLVLPMSEQLLFFATLVGKKLLKMNQKPYIRRLESSRWMRFRTRA